MRSIAGFAHRTAPLGLWLGLWLGIALTVAGPAAAVDDETLAEVLQILRDEGLIDEERHAEMSAELAERSKTRSWLDRIAIWGDFRGRYDGIFFDRDGVSRALGERLPNRHRARYRARLNLSAEVNERATVYLRLASGDDDPRSANQTLGRGVDFDTDDLRLDRAYLTLTPTPGGALCCVPDGYLGLDLGKVPNPFLWKDLGLDGLVWDSDINPEGGSLRLRGSAGPVQLFANGGIYVIDENSDSKDPQLVGGQVGGSVPLSGKVRLGARGSLYHYFSLDDDFLTRAADGGNIADGFTRRGGSVQVLEGGAFLALEHFELFPVLLFGSYAHNLSARSSLATGVGRNDDAYLVGIFVGDKARLVRLGFGRIAIQANALPAMFVDSSLTDGETNREGYVWSLERQLWTGIDFRYRVLKLNRIRGGPAFVDSIPGSDRVRMQADVQVHF